MDILKIAIPNKGRLSEKIYKLLNDAGLTFETKDERTLQVCSKDGLYQIIFVRTQDIPRFVEDNVADMGFTGRDVVIESEVDVDIIKDLDFGWCKMVVAVKEEDPDTLGQTVKVATSFPNIAKKYFEEKGIQAKIIEVSGATEITPRLGLSDVVVDITSSGETLKSNKLKIIDKILESTAVIIARKNLSLSQQDKVTSLLRALDSVLDAREKKYLMVNLPKKSLKEIKAFLPGLSAPTVTTLLDDEENVVVHVVVDKDKVYKSVEKLKELGGGGILIMTVDQMVK